MARVRMVIKHHKFNSTGNILLNLPCAAPSNPEELINFRQKVLDQFEEKYKKFSYQLEYWQILDSNECFNETNETSDLFSDDIEYDLKLTGDLKEKVDMARLDGILESWVKWPNNGLEIKPGVNNKAGVLECLIWSFPGSLARHKREFGGFVDGCRKLFLFQEEGRLIPKWREIKNNGSIK